MNNFLFFNGKNIGNIFSQDRKILLDSDFDTSMLCPSIQNNDVTNFLENLLPEGYELSKMAASKKLSTNDTFGLVCSFGEDMPGSIKVLKSSDIDNASAYLDEIGLEGIAKRTLREKDESFEDAIDTINSNQETRLSLPGAQGKFGVSIIDGKIFRPMRGSLSTHIVKYDSNPSFTNVVLNEYICMQIAKKIGMNVANTDYEPKSGSLIVERYDRYVDQGKIKSLHQFDFCQALDVPSVCKYQKDADSLGINQMREFLNNVSANPLKDRESLFSYVVFSYLIGNRDGHLKNFSMVINDGDYSLAPMYDIVSTVIYPNLDKSLSLLINGKNNSLEIGVKDFAKQFSIKEPLAAKRINSISSSIDLAINDEKFVNELRLLCGEDFDSVFTKIKQAFEMSRFHLLKSEVNLDELYAEMNKMHENGMNGTEDHTNLVNLINEIEEKSSRLSPSV